MIEIEKREEKERVSKGGDWGHRGWECRGPNKGGTRKEDRDEGKRKNVIIRGE